MKVQKNVFVAAVLIAGVVTFQAPRAEAFNFLEWLGFGVAKKKESLTTTPVSNGAKKRQNGVSSDIQKAKVVNADEVVANLDGLQVIKSMSSDNLREFTLKFIGIDGSLQSTQLDSSTVFTKVQDTLVGFDSQNQKFYTFTPNGQEVIAKTVDVRANNAVGVMELRVGGDAALPQGMMND